MIEAKEWKSPGELVDWVRSQATRPDGILSLAVLCEPRSPGRATCLADVIPEYAPQLAAELRGQTFGFGTVVVSLGIGPGFECRGRPDIPCNCSCRPTAA